MNSKGPLLLTLTLLAIATPSQAMTVLIVGDDFDGTGGVSYSYGFEYSGYGPTTGGNVDTSGSSTSSHSTTGPGNGGNAAETTADFSALATAIPTPNNYAYDGFAVGTGFNVGAWTGSTVDDFDPGDLGLLYIEFDYFLAGANPGVTSVNGDLDLEFRTPNGVVPGDASGSGGIDWALTVQDNPISLSTGAWTTVSLPIASLSPTNGTALTDFNTYATQITQFQLNLTAQTNSAFGYDADNALRIDNLRLVAIPEPSRTSLLALALTSLLLRRKR